MSDVTEIFKSEIQEAADSLVKSLPITEIQLRELTDDEVKELHNLITAVKEAADENEQIGAVVKNAKLIGKLISQF